MPEFKKGDVVAYIYDTRISSSITQCEVTRLTKRFIEVKDRKGTKHKLQPEGDAPYPRGGDIWSTVTMCIEPWTDEHKIRIRGQNARNRLNLLKIDKLSDRDAIALWDLWVSLSASKS